MPARPAPPPAPADAGPPPARGAIDRARLVQRVAAAGCPGPLRVVARTDSTQARARLAAAAGVPEGWTLVAEVQTRGRGRSGRGWWAPPRSAVLASMLWRPGLAPDRLRGLSLAAGVAVADALQAQGVADVSLRWPNDCLAGGRKLAGVLIEVVPAGPPPAPPAVVVGIGCNHAVAEWEWPEELAGLATSCVDHGAGPDRTALAGALLGGLWRGYRRWLAEGASWVADAWWRLDRSRGTEVTAEGRDGPVRGVVLGLAPGGGLRLGTARGERVVEAGEVRRVRPMGTPPPPGSGG